MLRSERVLKSPNFVMVASLPIALTTFTNLSSILIRKSSLKWTGCLGKSYSKLQANVGAKISSIMVSIYVIIRNDMLGSRKTATIRISNSIGKISKFGKNPRKTKNTYPWWSIRLEAPRLMRRI